MAPFGRGAKTIVDTSVRKVWQLPLKKVHITGTTWPNHFQEILSEIKVGLGCENTAVAAELYKMLIYDEGCFFLPHRDTEKTEGMFGTLVIVLPSSHQGGELIVRHAGHATKIDMSNTEISSLSFAAFYADCEHEVLPIREGSRVCLIYNLIQKSQKQQPSLSVPLYDTEIDKAAKIIEKTLTEDLIPIKIAWLLEHQYTPAALSFKTLKSRDAALAQVLSQAATRVGCVAHLGIVHLEESGSAEFDYTPRRRSRWEYDDEEINATEFEVIEVCDTRQYIDGWTNLQNQSVDFGELPLEKGELLPRGALDGQPPDEQRLTEATGNEGVSFERSYHRVALVLWRKERYAEVLLQAGVFSIIPYFKERIAASCSNSSLRTPTIALANLILDHWEAENQSYQFREHSPNRSEMLHLLTLFKEPPLLERFISHIITKTYDGSENTALVTAATLFNPETVSRLFSQLISTHLERCPTPCIDLLSLIIEKIDRFEAQTITTATVAALKNMGKVPLTPNLLERIRHERKTPIDFTLIVKLWNAFIQLKTDHLSPIAAKYIIASPTTFDPEKIITPALCHLNQQHGKMVHADIGFMQLWYAASQFLLARSEHFPKPPKDWRQEVTITCHCQDCKELQSFVSSPETQVHLFRVNKDRRQHLHRMIDNCDIEMTHVTMRTGSPQTLVCTKTRRNYEAKFKQYQADIAAMASLIPIFGNTGETCQRLIQAISSSTVVKKNC